MAMDPERAVNFVAPYLPAHPARETLVAPLLLAYYRSRRQPEALAAYERLRKHLAEELGADPSPDLQDLYLKILRQDLAVEAEPAPPSSAPVALCPRRRLPAYASPFLGRAEELSNVLALLGSHRIVTLMGIGVIGKTRLAVEATEQEVHDTSAEAWFVDLAEVSAQGQENPARAERVVARVVTAVLGLPTPREDSVGLTERIAASLQGREALVVLDNCEHVVEGAASFAERLLRNAGSVRLLATSREPLALPEEQRYRVPQLPVKGEYLHSANELEQLSPAVEFFLTRVRAVNSDVVVDQSILEAAEQLCRHLDGLPLALELAAAQTNVLSIPELLERITDRLDLLSRPGRAAPRRQQTLRAMLEWSWSLLDDEERALLRRLAVHPVSWRLDVIEEICASSRTETATQWPAYTVEIPPSRILPLLSHLVDSSLMATVNTSDGLRYRLLETVHSYAAEQLSESGEQPAVAARHVTYFQELAECAEIYLFAHHAKGWIDRIDAERGHLTHALTEALRREDVQSATLLVMSTFWFRWMTGRIDSLGEELAAVAACTYPGRSSEDRNRHAQVKVLARTLQAGKTDARVEGVVAALDGFEDDDAGPLAKMQVQWFAASCMLAHQTHGELGERLADEAVEYLLAVGELSRAAFAAAQRDYFLMEHFDIRPKGLPVGYDAEEILREQGDADGRTQLLAVQYLVAVADGATSRAQEITEEAVQLADSLGLEGELSYWESVRTLNSVRFQDLDAAQSHLHRTKELARRTAYAFCIMHPDALEAVLEFQLRDPEQAEKVLAGLRPAERNTAHRSLSRLLGEDALPAGLRLSRA